MVQCNTHFTVSRYNRHVHAHMHTCTHACRNCHMARLSKNTVVFVLMRLSHLAAWSPAALPETVPWIISAAGVSVSADMSAVGSCVLLFAADHAIGGLLWSGWIGVRGSKRVPVGAGDSGGRPTTTPVLVIAPGTTLFSVLVPGPFATMVPGLLAGAEKLFFLTRVRGQMDCLLPPLTTIPHGLWKCPLCLPRHLLPLPATLHLRLPFPILDFDSD